MTRIGKTVLWASGSLLCMGLLDAAAAKILCQNGFQMVQGSWLATPYCQDDLVAKVAGQYGVRASAAEIRNNPNFKRHVCRFIGQDIRIKETCDEVEPTGRGRF